MGGGGAFLFSIQVRRMPLIQVPFACGGRWGVLVFHTPKKKSKKKIKKKNREKIKKKRAPSCFFITLNAATGVPGP
jgi:hypothetical protein